MKMKLSSSTTTLFWSAETSGLRSSRENSRSGGSFLVHLSECLDGRHADKHFRSLIDLIYYVEVSNLNKDIVDVV